MELCYRSYELRPGLSTRARRLLPCIVWTSPAGQIPPRRPAAAQAVARRWRSRAASSPGVAQRRRSGCARALALAQTQHTDEPYFAYIYKPARSARSDLLGPAKGIAGPSAEHCNGLRTEPERSTSSGCCTGAAAPANAGVAECLRGGGAGPPAAAVSGGAINGSVHATGLRTDLLVLRLLQERRDARRRVPPLQARFQAFLDVLGARVGHLAALLRSALAASASPGPAQRPADHGRAVAPALVQLGVRGALPYHRAAARTHAPCQSGRGCAACAPPHAPANGRSGSCRSP